MDEVYNCCPKEKLSCIYMVSLLVSSKSRVSEVVINLLREVGSTFIRTKVQLATLRKIYFSSLKRQNIEIMKYGSHDYMI